MILVTSFLCCSHCQVQTGKVGHGYFPLPQSNVCNPTQSILAKLLTRIAHVLFHSVHVCFMRRICYMQCACEGFIDGLLVPMVYIRLNRTQPFADAGFFGMVLKHTQCLMQLKLAVWWWIGFSAIAPAAVWQLVCMFSAWILTNCFQS